MKRYVIIGGGVSAMNCIEGIRSLDKDGFITMVTDEPVFNYGRPLISYYLQGRTDLKRMAYRPESFFEDNNVRVIAGKKAEKLMPKEKQVLTEGSEILPYDALCVCAGSRPLVPAFKGLDKVSNCFSFISLNDALRLECAVDACSRVLIIGAGFIGLKCAEGLSGRAAKITVCDLAPKVMAASLDEDASAIVAEQLRRSGIDLRLSDTAESFEDGVAHMKSGRDIAFDVLVIAIGVRANTELIAGAGGSVGKGIITDSGMKTSLDSVWAAGDCVQSIDAVSGESGVLAILPNAAMQGFTAGRNMAGASDVIDKSMRMNSIGLFGMHIMSAGITGDCIYSEVSGSGCRKFFAKDGRLCGFIMTGDVSRAGIYTSLIRNRVPLEGIDMRQLAEYPSLLLFGTEYRKEKLGGLV